MNDNEIRKHTAKSPEESMRDFIDGDIDEEENYIYTGIVVNNDDKDKQGKCQIRVYSIFGEDVPDKDLPWALPDFSFIGSTVGNFIVPPKNAIVNVYFDKGDIYLPHYTTKAVRKSKQPTQKDIDYPDNMVMFETDEGDYLTINRKSKETTYKHNSGTKVLIKKDGSVEIEVKGSESTTVTGNIVIEGKSNVTIKHGAILTVEGSTVIPTGTGPLCGLPSCVITGTPHTGTKCLP
jgi:hypothetical protein